jgi:hypothetical protein
VAVGIVLGKVMGEYWTIIYSSLFAILYLAGRLWFDDAPPRWFFQPFRSLGATGMVVISWLLTSRWPWEYSKWDVSESPALLEHILAVSLPLAAMCFLFLCVRRYRGSGAMLGALPVLAVLGYFLARVGVDAFAISLIFNAYFFVLGVAILAGGIRERSLGRVNLGMAVLGVLIVTRFFDSELSFVARGVAFIVVGMGFLAANLVLLRRDRGGAR